MNDTIIFISCLLLGIALFFAAFKIIKQEERKCH